MKAVFIIFAVVLVCVYSQQPPVPPFLQGAPQSTIQEFNDLLENAGGLTDAQIDAKVEQWVQKQSAAIKTKFVSFKSELKKAQNEAENAHKSALAKFSPAAKAADAKLTAIANNPSLTAQAKGQQIEQILSSLPTNVRQEIEAAMRGGQ